MPDLHRLFPLYVIQWRGGCYSCSMYDPTKRRCKRRKPFFQGVVIPDIEQENLDVYPPFLQCFYAAHPSGRHPSPRQGKMCRPVADEHVSESKPYFPQPPGDQVGPVRLEDAGTIMSIRCQPN